MITVLSLTHFLVHGSTTQQNATPTTVDNSTIPPPLPPLRLPPVARRSHSPSRSLHPRQPLQRRTYIANDPECDWSKRFWLSLVLEELLRWTAAASRVTRFQSQDRELNIARTAIFRDAFGMHVRNREAELVGWRFIGLLLEVSPLPQYEDFRVEQGIDPRGRIMLRCGQLGGIGCRQPDDLSETFPRANQIFLVRIKKREGTLQFHPTF